MMYDTEEILSQLVSHISKMSEVQSIGMSGSKTQLPKPNEGDIDIFIYCSEIPTQEKRQRVIQMLEDGINNVILNLFKEGHWGTGDFLCINGIEAWLMYFRVNDTNIEIDKILHGEYPDKLDNYYYPIGRCAMLQSIHILYDKTKFLNDMKKKLVTYPEKLAKILTDYHLEELNDTEDLERAVARKDVLFYHFALDLALDHYLQALFAINHTYFPSRKRTFEKTQGFRIKPHDFEVKILDVIRWGGHNEGINQSYSLWKQMVNELKMLGHHLESI